MDGAELLGATTAASGANKVACSLAEERETDPWPILSPSQHPLLDMLIARRPRSVQACPHHVAVDGSAAELDAALSGPQHQNVRPGQQLKLRSCVCDVRVGCSTQLVQALLG